VVLGLRLYRHSGAETAGPVSEEFTVDTRIA
jgi:hypothetical protein